MNSNLLSKLIEKRIIKCSTCGDNNLMELNDKLICSQCNSLFSKKNGVVDFVNYCSDTTENKEIFISKNIILSLLDKLLLPNSSDTYSRVEDIYRRSFKKTNNTYHSAEINCVLDRFGIEAEQNSSQHNSNSVKDRDLALSTNVDFNIVYERHYVENILPSASTVYRNVRLRNNGASKWSSTTEKPVFLSYRWINKTRNIVVLEGEITAFPIDILPLRAITLPLKIKTPVKLGSYTLQIAMVQKGVKWIDSNSLDIPIKVENINASPALSCLEVNNDFSTYEEDHRIAKNIIEETIVNNYGNKNIFLLEVGGGTHPQLGFMNNPESEVVNIDISTPLLELGSLFFEHHTQKQNLCFLCCDAVNAPFTESSFDGIVMFSTLHHFAEPEKLLINLGKYLRKDGFLAIMSEPVGNDLNHETAIRDLLSGINEQVFTLEEYLSIFEISGLTPTFVRVDGGSMKAILKLK